MLTYDNYTDSTFFSDELENDDDNQNHLHRSRNQNLLQCFVFYLVDYREIDGATLQFLFQDVLPRRWHQHLTCVAQQAIENPSGFLLSCAVARPDLLY